MPVYDYLCRDCGAFSARRPMMEAALPMPCPTCEGQSPRVIAAPQLNLMSEIRRRVDARNEKSAHAPEVVHRSAHEPAGRCSHGHSHGGDGARRPAHVHAHARTPSRPWMIGH
ncbi:MAG TPA: zinc ribbon domain-containing protein [Zeimonas sp.]|nr:zinc ribbon domain-containing protein [Zeimonas sp.]